MKGYIVTPAWFRQDRQHYFRDLDRMMEPDQFGMTPRCECPAHREATMPKGGPCQATDYLKRYDRNGRTIRLCLFCVMPGDVPADQPDAVAR